MNTGHPLNTPLNADTIRRQLSALEVLMDEQDREFAALQATLNAATSRPSRAMSTGGGVFLGTSQSKRR